MGFQKMSFPVRSELREGGQVIQTVLQGIECQSCAVSRLVTDNAMLVAHGRCVSGGTS